MQKLLVLTILPIVLLLSGCSNLPESRDKLKLTIGQKDYLLAQAKNQEQKEEGLMFIKNLPQNEGMIFYFDKPEKQTFWMKNTYIPLQIIFINGCKIIDIQEMAVEQDPTKPQKKYSSSEPADKAIEIKAGTFKTNLIGTKIDDLCVIDDGL